MSDEKMSSFPRENPVLAAARSNTVLAEALAKCDYWGARIGEMSEKIIKENEGLKSGYLYARADAYFNIMNYINGLVENNGVSQQSKEDAIRILFNESIKDLTEAIKIIKGNLAQNIDANNKRGFLLHLFQAYELRMRICIRDDNFFGQALSDIDQAEEICRHLYIHKGNHLPKVKLSIQDKINSLISGALKEADKEKAQSGKRDLTKYREAFHRLVEINGINPKQIINNDGDTLLHVAVRGGDAEVVEYLLARTDITAQDIKNQKGATVQDLLPPKFSFKDQKGDKVQQEKSVRQVLEKYLEDHKARNPATIAQYLSQILRNSDGLFDANLLSIIQEFSGSIGVTDKPGGAPKRLEDSTAAHVQKLKGGNGNANAAATPEDLADSGRIDPEAKRQSEGAGLMTGTKWTSVVKNRRDDKPNDKTVT